MIMCLRGLLESEYLCGQRVWVQPEDSDGYEVMTE